MATGDEPLFNDDGTNVSWGIRPNELNPDSGVADADDVVDAAWSKYVELPPVLELELLLVEDGVVDCW